MKIAYIATTDISLRYLLLNQMLSIKQKGYEVVGVSSPGQEVAEIQKLEIRPLEQAAFQLAGQRKLEIIDSHSWPATSGRDGSLGKSSNVPTLEIVLETMRLIKAFFESYAT